MRVYKDLHNYLNELEQLNLLPHMPQPIQLMHRLNAVGLENLGYRELARVRDSLKDVGIPVIVSIAGSKVDEFTTIASYVIGF